MNISKTTVKAHVMQLHGSYFPPTANDAYRTKALIAVAPSMRRATDRNVGVTLTGNAVAHQNGSRSRSGT